MRKKVAELEKLKIHPKDISENQLVMERLQRMYETSALYLREEIQTFIRYFEALLERQNLRQIKKYRLYLEKILDQLENDDPFREEVIFPEYDDTDWDEDEAFDIFDGRESSKWTN